MGTSITSSFSYGRPYDVFISFRGEDTRYGFIAYLYQALSYKGIRTFLNEEELKGGEEIKSTCFKAIEKSKIAIVVLSRNYASSSFCLDELVKILHCFHQGKCHLVLPVFYDVHPSDVRLLRGSYREAMIKHEQNFQDGTDKVKKWREALSKVADFSGYLIDRRYEYMAINNIVEDILGKKRGIFHLTQEKARRYAGIASTVAGLVCYALSSSFNRLYGEWTSLKISGYSLSSFMICLAISFPDAYGIVSSAAFAAMSLCMSKKVACGFLDLMYSFCGLMMLQLLEIELKLFLAGIALTALLFFLISTRLKDKRQDHSEMKEIRIE